MLGVRRQEMKQVATSSQLGNDEELIVDAKDIVETNDVIVTTKFPQDIYFFL